METLSARKDEIEGLGVASEEQIEASLLYMKREGGAEILSLQTRVDDGGARLRLLLGRLRAPGLETVRFPKVHPAEISKDFLETLGFRPAGAHRLYAANLRQR